MAHKKKAKPMTTAAYRRAVDDLALSQIKAGAVVGLSPRQAQRVYAGHSPVPPPVSKLLNLIVEGKVTVEDVTEAG